MGNIGPERPQRPTFEGSRDDVERALWDWFVELQSWELQLLRAGLPLDEAANEYEALIREGGSRLKTHSETANRVMKANCWMASFSQKLGNCYRRLRRHADAINALGDAKRVKPGDIETLEDFVECLLEAGDVETAIFEINEFDRSCVRNTRGSTAAKVLEWALGNSSVALGIDATLLKHCVSLLAKYPDEKAKWLAHLAKEASGEREKIHQ